MNINLTILKNNLPNFDILLMVINVRMISNFINFDNHLFAHLNAALEKSLIVVCVCLGSSSHTLSHIPHDIYIFHISKASSVYIYIRRVKFFRTVFPLAQVDCICI